MIVVKNISFWIAQPRWPVDRVGGLMCISIAIAQSCQQFRQRWARFQMEEDSTSVHHDHLYAIQSGYATG